MRHPRGTFGPTERLQKQYEQGIRKIVGRVLKPILPGQSFDQWIAALAERSKQQDIFEASTWLASRMVHWANVGTQRTWREAAENTQRSAYLYKLLNQELKDTPTGARISQLIRENAAYISSIPLEVATTLTGEIAKAQQAGARPATIAKMYRTRFPKLLKSRVNLISRTETARASAALTRARAESVNADWYEWLSSTDARTREGHRNLHGVLVNWNDPPNPEQLVGEAHTVGHYNCGEVFNCRCVTAPMLHVDDVSWPRRVYSKGRITQMTKQKFLATFSSAPAVLKAA
jgi:SPP1 gp7 family putative phage head morphogenesis protein